MQQAEAKREKMVAARKDKAAKAAARVLKAQGKENCALRVANDSAEVPDVFRTRSHGEDAPVVVQQEPPAEFARSAVGGFTTESGWD